MKKKNKVLFVCYGNFCRSPMAEYQFRNLVEHLGLAEQFEIASAATSREDVGSRPHHEAVRVLAEHGISMADKRAVQMTQNDYAYYDYILAMDHKNLRALRPFVGSDPEEKVSLLLDYTDHPADIADPWYTQNFEQTYADIDRGLQGFLHYLYAR